MCEGLSAEMVWRDMKRRPPHEQPPQLRATLAAAVAAEMLVDGAVVEHEWEAACRGALALLEEGDSGSAMTLLRLACQA